MKKNLLLFCSLIICAPAISHAAYTYKNGKLIKSAEVATMSVQEHYSAAMEAYGKENWDELIRHSVIVIRNFSSSPFAGEVCFFLGVGYFQTGEYEFSNRFLTKYLKNLATPRNFEEAIQLKFRIAEKYHHGARKHVLGVENLPKWVPAREEAVAIYDEVITALPHHELAARALFGKARLLLEIGEFKSSIETFQVLIRRFPKHPLAAESYIGIGEVYLVQAQKEYPDQDFLDLAEINLRRFRHDFPGEEKLCLGEKMFLEMKEVYASDFYDTARFYERTDKPQAAYLYYTRILAKYPETKVCELVHRRLSKFTILRASETAPAEAPLPAVQPTQEGPQSPLLQLQEQGLTVDSAESSGPEASP
jgi:outer membrane protein assembly factor BamD (BamD/ComL family)